VVSTWVWIYPQNAQHICLHSSRRWTVRQTNTAREHEEHNDWRKSLAYYLLFVDSRSKRIMFSSLDLPRRSTRTNRQATYLSRSRCRNSAIGFRRETRPSREMFISHCSLLPAMPATSNIPAFISRPRPASLVFVTIFFFYFWQDRWAFKEHLSAVVSLYTLRQRGDLARIFLRCHVTFHFRRSFGNPSHLLLERDSDIFCSCSNALVHVMPIEGNKEDELKSRIKLLSNAGRLFLAVIRTCSVIDLADWI